MKEHLVLSDDDDFNVQNIPSPPMWLLARQSRKKRERARGFRVPRWCSVTAGVVITFFFMLSPAGRAVSNFLNSLDIRWNADKSMLEIQYMTENESNTPAKRPTGNIEGTALYHSVEEVQAVYPELVFVINDEYAVQDIEVTGLGISLLVSYVFVVEDTNVIVSQTFYFTDVAQESNMLLTGNAVPIEAKFNRGAIAVTGGYEDGYGHVYAFEKNYAFTFLCDDLELDVFLNFIESCYLE